LLFHPQGRNFKSYLLVLVGLAIGWFPFLLFEIRHNFPNFISLYRFIFYGEETGLATGGLSRVGDIVYRLYSRLVTNNESILAWGLLACSLVFLVYHWWHSRKDQNDLRTSSLLGIWLILGVSLFIFYRKPVYDYYLGFLFSLPFLLTAMALDKTAAWGKQGKIIFYLVGLILLVVNLKGAPFRFVPNRQLTQTKEVARFILTRVAGRPFNFALITGSNSDHAYRYFFEIWGNPPVVIENLQVDPTRKTVTDQLWVICETLPCVPEGHSLWEIAGFGRAKIVGEWQVSVVKVYQLKHYQGNE
jgi:hypothetical protein